MDLTNEILKDEGIIQVGLIVKKREKRFYGHDHSNDQTVLFQIVRSTSIGLVELNGTVT